MMLTQMQGTGGNAHFSLPGRGFACVHVDGPQGVESAITTNSLARRAQAKTIERDGVGRWRDRCTKSDAT